MTTSHIPSHPHLISCLISCHVVSSHDLISSHLISSHLIISSHLCPLMSCCHVVSSHVMYEVMSHPHDTSTGAWKLAHHAHATTQQHAHVDGHTCAMQGHIHRINRIHQDMSIARWRVEQATRVADGEESEMYACSSFRVCCNRVACCYDVV